MYTIDQELMDIKVIILCIEKNQIIYVFQREEGKKKCSGCDEYKKNKHINNERSTQISTILKTFFR